MFIDITDAETVREAHKNAEGYQNLIVRVAGFAAHFAVLTLEMRQMVAGQVMANSR